MNNFNLPMFDVTNFDARAMSKQMGAVVDYWTETYVENVQKAAEQVKTAAEQQVAMFDTMLKATKKTSK